MSVSDQLDATFLALADPTRRAILARLAHGEAPVGELAAPFNISQPAISKHLRILERAALVSVGQDAQRRPRRIEAKPLAEASAWIEGFRQVWEANFERLDGLLEELQRDRPSKRGRKVKGKPRHVERTVPSIESDLKTSRKRKGANLSWRIDCRKRR